jgi:hypothetical protein
VFPAKIFNCSALRDNRLKASTGAASSEFHLFIENSPVWRDPNAFENMYPRGF